jgi:predicted ester cyclase
MSESKIAKEAKAVVRRNTEEVQVQGRFDVFEELFADGFVDHTPQPGFGTDKDDVRKLYLAMREAFPDFRAEIHWQYAEGGVVTTFKTYFGTHLGRIFSAAPTGRKVRFETIDVMRITRGRITDHWGVANLLSLMVQLGAIDLQIPK